MSSIFYLFLISDGECQVVLVFSEVGKKSHERDIFLTLNRLVKCPRNERKRTVQPRFPCAGKREVNSIFSWC